MGRAGSSSGSAPDLAWGTRSLIHSGVSTCGAMQSPKQSQSQASLECHLCVQWCGAVRARSCTAGCSPSTGIAPLSQPRPPLFPVTGASAGDGHRTSLVSTPRGLSTTQVKLVCRCWLLKELKCRSRCRTILEPCGSSLWTRRGPVSAHCSWADPEALPQLGLPRSHCLAGRLSPYSLHCPLTHSPVGVQALHERAVLQPVEQCELWKPTQCLARHSHALACSRSGREGQGGCKGPQCPPGTGTGTGPLPN